MRTPFTKLFCIGLSCRNLHASATAFSKETAEFREVGQFPSETYVENIAVRANGQLLVTLLTSPELYQVNPFEDEDPILVHRFPRAIGALGIVETEPDIFAVVTGNFTRTASVPRSYSVWKVDVRAFDNPAGSPAIVGKITDIPEAQLLNGATLLEQSSGTVLIADSLSGVVWGLDTRTGNYDVVLDDPRTKAPPGPNPLGINGLHIRNRSVYFTNSGRNVLARVPIHLNNGTAAGPYQVVANLNTSFCDDFAFDATGIAYVATGLGATIFKVRTNGNHTGMVTVVEGDVQPPALAGTMAAAFGRTLADREILYVTTRGGSDAPVNGSAVRGGKILAVDTRMLKK